MRAIVTRSLSAFLFTGLLLFGLTGCGEIDETWEVEEGAEEAMYDTHSGELRVITTNTDADGDPAIGDDGTSDPTVGEDPHQPPVDRRPPSFACGPRDSQKPVQTLCYCGQRDGGALYLSVDCAGYANTQSCCAVKCEVLTDALDSQL